jgi:hypothetical protein
MAAKRFAEERPSLLCFRRDILQEIRIPDCHQVRSETETPDSAGLARRYAPCLLRRTFCAGEVVRLRGG